MYGFDNDVEVELSRSRLKGCLFRSVVVLVILGLLSSAIAGVVWFVTRRAEATAVTNTVNEIATAASASPSAPEVAPAGTAVSAQPTPVQNPINRIVFINPDGQVETIAPDGHDGRLLTGSDKNFLFPVWSPDGNYLAAIGRNRSGAGVYLLTDGGEAGEPVELYASRAENPIYLYWSPDNNRIGFIASHFGNNISLYLAGVDGGSRLLTTGSPFYWDWVATGDQLLIHTGFVGEGARLELIDADGNGRGQNIARPGFFQAPGISAGGRYWAYAEENGADMSWLVVSDTQTGERQQIRHAGIVAMAWSPVHEQLAFVSASRDALEFVGPLRLLDVQTGVTRLLSRETVLAFFWSPDGRYIAYFTSPGGNEGDINASARDNYPARTTARSKPSRQTNSHPLNLIVVDVISGEQKQLAAIEPTTSFLTQILPFFDQYAHSHRLWSPASDALVLPIRENGKERIVIVPINGREIRRLVEGDMPFWSQR